MGACDFMTDRYPASSAREAFKLAQEDARYEYGNGGYTGTIAEKHSFKMIPYNPTLAPTPEKYAWDLITNDDPRIEDKHGPAGCIDCGNGEYIFFGWASS